jgi:hypothetical protein
MSAERVEQANRVDIVAARRTTRKVFLWTPDIAYLDFDFPQSIPDRLHTTLGDSCAQSVLELYPPGLTRFSILAILWPE